MIQSIIKKLSLTIILLGLLIFCIFVWLNSYRIILLLDHILATFENFPLFCFTIFKEKKP